MINVNHFQNIDEMIVYVKDLNVEQIDREIFALNKSKTRDVHKKYNEKVMLQVMEVVKRKKMEG